MYRNVRRLLTAIGIFALVPSVAQATTHEFYKGKTIRLIVGLSAGGGYDVYSRAIARHMGKHIPGNPVIVEENIREIFKLEPGLVEKLKEILK